MNVNKSKDHTGISLVMHSSINSKTIILKQYKNQDMIEKPRRYNLRVV